MNSYLGLGIILGVLFLSSVSLNYGLYASNNYKPLNYSSDPSDFSLNASDVGAKNHLSLTMILDASTISPGQSVDLTIYVSNILGTANAVNASRDWPLSSLSLGGCGTLNYPMGYAVYSGFYSASDISAATPLSIIHPGIYNCPAIFYIGSYVFSPSSTKATLVGSDGNVLFSDQMSAGTAISGYWTYNPLTDPYGNDAHFHNFSSGVYTIAGGDEWGNLVILHFKVA
jgi:hypothetical protein